tara:strand:+ start:4364 stop:4609 length:246 start_codon:yes stop_codon:yes gene_type:complete
MSINLEQGVINFSNSTVGTFSITGVFDKPPTVTIGATLSGSDQPNVNFWVHSTANNQIILSASQPWSGEVHINLISMTVGA